jgi:hypothetical protein
MNQKTVTLKIIREGQPRAYADSDYEGVFTFSWEPSESQVKAFARLMLHEFYDEPPHAVAPRLEKCESRSAKEWYVHIHAPYTD